MNHDQETLPILNWNINDTIPIPRPSFPASDSHKSKSKSKKGSSRPESSSEPEEDEVPGSLKCTHVALSKTLCSEGIFLDHENKTTEKKNVSELQENHSNPSDLPNLLFIFLTGSYTKDTIESLFIGVLTLKLSQSNENNHQEEKTETRIDNISSVSTQTYDSVSNEMSPSIVSVAKNYCVVLFQNLRSNDSSESKEKEKKGRSKSGKKKENSHALATSMIKVYQATGDSKRENSEEESREKYDLHVTFELEGGSVRIVNAEIDDEAEILAVSYEDGFIQLFELSQNSSSKKEMDSLKTFNVPQNKMNASKENESDQVVTDKEKEENEDEKEEDDNINKNNSSNEGHVKFINSKIFVVWWQGQSKFHLCSIKGNTIDDVELMAPSSLSCIVADYRQKTLVLGLEDGYIATFKMSHWKPNMLIPLSMKLPQHKCPIKQICLVSNNNQEEYPTVCSFGTDNSFHAYDMREESIIHYERWYDMTIIRSNEIFSNLAVVTTEIDERSDPEIEQKRKQEQRFREMQPRNRSKTKDLGNMFSFNVETGKVNWILNPYTNVENFTPRKIQGRMVSDVSGDFKIASFIVGEENAERLVLLPIYTS
eukprot:gb/GECH01006534.1/.p1 GENE.gb/GECH01006534.1/~~gb/GECH01006534.1/.p1  ORF type:complete len:597 (+),score=138.42 gb/GECH01006534.1/:1-1791(+)